jgi:hypothetical protein
MNNMSSEQLRERVAGVIARAWPCYVHYADPRELVGDDETIRWVLTRLASTVPTTESSLPSMLPQPQRIVESMILGHEHHAACLTLATALTRCIPALTQDLQQRRCQPPDRDDQYTTRAALADAHRRHHRLDPTGQDDTQLLEALCTRIQGPLEVSAAWQYMVRITQDDAMGGPLGAFDFMPMRCFIDLAHARNWCAMQAMWDCHILGEDVPSKLADPRIHTVLQEIAKNDGSDHTWRLPFTNTTLRLTRHTADA